MSNKKSQYISEYIIRELQKINMKNMTVLDVGCGTGEYIPYLKGKITGIDFDKKLVAIAKQKYPKVKFLIHDCTKLPLPIKSDVDFIFSTELVEHLKKNDAIKLIKEFEKTSRIIFISTPNVNNFTSLVRFIVFRTIAIAGTPNTVEKVLFFLKNKKKTPKFSKYPVVEEKLLEGNPNKDLHYHVSNFNTAFFKMRGYRVIGGLGFMSYNAIKNKTIRNMLDAFFYYFPYFAGDILAIKIVRT